jgi:hypothetical protein
VTLTCGVVVVELRGFEPLTPCMPCSFSTVRSPSSGAVSQLRGPIRLTVIDRWIPLVTAAYGTWVARRARTTIVRTWRRRVQLASGCGRSLGDWHIVGKNPEGSRQA